MNTYRSGLGTNLLLIGLGLIYRITKCPDETKSAAIKAKQEPLGLLHHIGINLSICCPNAIRRGELSQHDINHFGWILSILWLFRIFVLSGQQETIPGYET